MIIEQDRKPKDLLPAIEHLFELSASKIIDIEKTWNLERGAPVFTIKGKYTTRGWTDWTHGFLFGSAILQYDATGKKVFLDIGRKGTVENMATHVSHFGVHDHGFNNYSTYGNLLRLMNENRIPENEWERNFYSLAIKISGAVQASRWTELPEDLGYIYSFNGPHSLFSDTIRTLRVLALSHQLGHHLMGESDEAINLLKRLIVHAETTARFNVYFGKGRDYNDVPGRVVHESIFNQKNGSYRNPSTQQGYSPFTTWTRGLAWIILGFAEHLEYIDSLDDDEINKLNLTYFQSKSQVVDRFLGVARITSDYYIKNTPLDGIPYWDTGAPGLVNLVNYLEKKADPANEFEPEDISADAIAAQGILRLGRYLNKNSEKNEGSSYFQAGLTIADRLFSEDYLSTDKDHQGLLLHSVYHRPNNWDHIPAGKNIPCGESSMWGDYHARELALYIKRIAENQPYLKFFW